MRTRFDRRRSGDHPEVVAALREDREVLFVSAPQLHPDDVRAVVIGTLVRLRDVGEDPAV